MSTTIKAWTTWTRRHASTIWQIAFILTGVSWLFGPALNTGISGRSSLISEYEVPGMPYSGAFRIFDVIAGVLLLLAVWRLHKQHGKWSLSYILLLIIGAAMALDPIATTTCRIVQAACTEYVSPSFIVHAIETVLAGAALFVLAVWDAFKRRLVPSVLYACFQVFYAALFISQLADVYDINTLTQVVYQAVTVVWLAWLVSSFMPGKRITLSGTVMHKVVALWVAVNGVAAILLSLVHLHYVGFIKGLYFTSDTAWIAQHGVVIGVALLYLSRHLARGERRALQLFLLLVGIEALTYAVIVPQPFVLSAYLLTFVGLFSSREYFGRGLMRQPWQSRMLDALVVVGGVLLAVVLMWYVFADNPRYYHILDTALGHYQEFVLQVTHFTQGHVRSSLLAHTITALAVATGWFVLWSLFRPSFGQPGTSDSGDGIRAEEVLGKYARSSEDFFKLWPADKQYFWSGNKNAFIAYKVVGPIAFALADPVARTALGCQRLLNDFVYYCRSHGLRACFLLVPQAAEALYHNVGLRTVRIGASAVIDVQQFVTETAKDKWWRWQRNRGQKAGYQYQTCMPPHAQVLLDELRGVSDAWLARNGRREQGFMLGYFDAAYLQRCRIHVLRDAGGSAVAFVNELPTFNGLPQTTIDLIRFMPDAPNAMPYLFEQVLQQISQQQQFRYFDMGFVPLAQMDGRLATIVRALGASRFSAAGLEQFKNKFDPNWRPDYMAYDGSLGDLALVALNLEKVMRVQEQGNQAGDSERKGRASQK